MLGADRGKCETRITGGIFNYLLSRPLNRAELVDVHLAAVLDSPSRMAITTSLVENGYEADFWKARLGTKKLHTDPLAARSQRL